MSATVLAFDRVALVTGGARVFDALDLAVAARERVGVVGDSGTGKSMLARLAIGLTPPLSGEVRLFDQPLASLRADALRAARGRCGVALQGGSLIEGLNVEDNLWLGLGAAATARARLRRKLDRAMLDFAIEHVAATPVSALSVGERRRVELARAFLRDPELVILDEPLEGASAEADRLERRIGRETGARGRAMLLLTQDVTLARRLCDRVLRLARGRLQHVEAGTDAPLAIA